MSNADVINRMDDVIQNIYYNTMIDGMSKIGMNAVNNAVANHEFNNDTNNLEDSYGYAIYYNGVLKQKFLFNPNASVLKDGKSGHEEAEKFFNDFSAGSGYTLIVVAAMYYAAYVEFEHGLDVLTNTYQKSKTEGEKVFKSVASYYNYKGSK